MEFESHPKARPAPGSDVDSTSTLLSRIRAGDESACDRLVERYLPALTRWARGRLPAFARDLSQTDDLVQITLLKALSQMNGFEPRHEGAFLAYLRRILTNQIRDEIRRVGRAPGRSELRGDRADDGPSPVEIAIGRERLGAYERALAKLPEEQQQAVVMRLEMAFTHQQIAESLGSPSPDAARMLLARALVRLAGAMRGGPGT